MIIIGGLAAATFFYVFSWKDDTKLALVLLTMLSFCIGSATAWAIVNLG